MEERVVPVVIAGGGPCGPMLANELGRRRVAALLVDEKPSTAFNSQANATQACTMEHFRRHRFAAEIRALGLPPEFPTDMPNSPAKQVPASLAWSPSHRSDFLARR